MNPRKVVDRLLAKYNHAVETVNDERIALSKARKQVRTSIAAQQIITEVAQKLQETVHEQFAGVVTRCLRTVFDDPYEFRIHFDKRRGRTEARLTFIRDGEDFIPTEESGGGVVDVAAFALRLSAILVSGKRRVMFLDEPFRFVSADYQRRVAQMLEGLAEDLRFQFILVTHEPELQCGTIVKCS